ncbi:MAG TPA: sulfurtransferase complex subunit TusC [Usitatibacter sp.]|nr:sulfurtransferase complex subunit TusC [Usitatibacter sp.]
MTDTMDMDRAREALLAATQPAASSEPRVRRFLFVNRKAPYGSVYALEGLEVVLITAAFDQDVSLAYLDDGVYQLVKGQNTKRIEAKNFSPTYRALEDYDITKLYVERESLEARGLTEDDLVVPVTVIPAAELAKLMDATDVLLSF